MKKRDYAFTLTKEQYDYLLPIYGNNGMIPNRLLQRVDKNGVVRYSYIGSLDSYKDVLNRLKYL